MRALLLAWVVGGALLVVHGCAAFSGADADDEPRDIPPPVDASVEADVADVSDERGEVDGAGTCEGVLFFDDFETRDARCGAAIPTVAGESSAARTPGQGADGSAGWRVSLPGVDGGQGGGAPPAGHFQSVVLAAPRPGTAMVLRVRVRSSCKDPYTSHLAIHCTNATFAHPKGADVYPGFLTLHEDVHDGDGGIVAKVGTDVSFPTQGGWLTAELELRTGEDGGASYLVENEEVAVIGGEHVACPSDRPDLVAQFGLFGWEACTAYFDDVRVTVRKPE